MFMMESFVGEDGMGHIYTEATATDFEFKGMFRISGEKTNSGLYFRAIHLLIIPMDFPAVMKPRYVITRMHIQVGFGNLVLPQEKQPGC
jgi:hypothetical protein